MKELLTILFFSCSFAVTSFSQETVRTYISFEYGIGLPQGDLQDRFGTTFNLGGQFEAMLNNSLWHAGVKGLFIFGNTVKEDVVSNLRTAQGTIIGNDRAPADFSLRTRGMFVGAYLGKVIPLGTNQKQSGIKLSVGGGLLQHKIRVQDNGQTINQITGEYKYGYDRLTNGPAVYGFLGYQHLDKNRRLNFLVGMDYTLGFTQNRRAYNFNEMRQDNTSRTDGFLGFRIGWILPISYGDAETTIYY